MKNCMLRRLTTTLLALAMLLSLFTVCGLAEETTSWDYKALLTADDGVNMEGTYPSEEEVAEELPVGFQVDFDRDSSTGACWVMNDFVVDLTSPLTEGQKVRSVLRMNASGGVSAVHRLYSTDGQTKVFDDGSMSVNQGIMDETYGYSYNEYCAETTVSAAASGLQQLKLWIVDVGVMNYKDNPWQIFGWDLYDANTNEKLCSYDASDFMEANCVKVETSSILYNPLYTDIEIGFTAVESSTNQGPYVSFDIYTYPGQTKPVQEGDLLQLNIKIWKPEGWLDLQPFYAAIDYYPDALTDPESHTKTELFGIEISNENQYEELESLIDETYGYEYKLVTVDHIVTASEAEKLNAKRCNPIIGSKGSQNYIDSPLSIYGYSFYNVTQDYCYAEMSGAEMLSSGGTGTMNEIISIRKYDNSYATAGAVKAKRNAIFDTLTVASGEIGQYGYTFDVKGEADKEYILKAYALDEEGKTTQVGQKSFTATGEQESVPMLFNLREAYAGQNICFGIETIEAALSVNTVKYDGRIGDCAQNDEYENQLLANPVIEMIDALPATIALTDEETIVAARTAYDALESNIQALVNNLADLEQAEAALAVLKADKAAADEVVAKIDALPVEVTAADEENVKAARAAYDALTESQQAMVTNLAKLEAAEAAFAIVYGDLNGDGKADASDALKALQHSVKLITLVDKDFTAGDVDKSGTIDATDALYILQYSVKLIDTLPVK